MSQKKEKVLRFGVSVEENLIQKFEKLIKRKGYTNRSEAIRDMIRNLLAVEAAEKGQEMVGAILIIYDHHRPHLVEKLLALQHDADAEIIASQHVHLDHHHCMETIIVRGPVEKLEDLQGRIGALKGVGQCLLSKASCQVLH
ncbi:MAG: nickel-responsive transcriptional regulator NikR [Candidatus Edwardsbacteria bacterium]|nr:nickel-responsive transcriptional regulator NikR [Candidatus Edwardsbacteria bacterium]MBU1576043.1 nickel-responsive transcriptional regulator NikR [Candidatus Edwardsbacteria bacterium]MBU2463066.1 nickel-responsive transcriptional regulator NikR [Candidatus Edwardsbacteria bacterium]MBU2594298.1 nickel-responsive transcriptional regulator NikR [Candidatus Edwardsbacteria bacterium]